MTQASTVSSASLQSHRNHNLGFKQPRRPSRSPNLRRLRRIHPEKESRAELARSQHVPRRAPPEAEQGGGVQGAARAPLHHGRLHRRHPRRPLHPPLPQPRARDDGAQVLGQS